MTPGFPTTAGAELFVEGAVRVGTQCPAGSVGTSANVIRQGGQKRGVHTFGETNT